MRSDTLVLRFPTCRDRIRVGCYSIGQFLGVVPAVPRPRSPFAYSTYYTERHSDRTSQHPERLSGSKSGGTGSGNGGNAKGVFKNAIVSFFCRLFRYDPSDDPLVQRTDHVIELMRELRLHAAQQPSNRHVWEDTVTGRLIYEKKRDE